MKVKKKFTVSFTGTSEVIIWVDDQLDQTEQEDEVLIEFSKNPKLIDDIENATVSKVEELPFERSGLHTGPEEYTESTEELIRRLGPPRAGN